ncbi:MAG: putative 7-carboxy-7-deazaguanine synthase QueE [Fusobacteriia bacterium 4572_132]|nr:MAG: putative 7-carboxy-7-deazaguanine synthase QueE [Fusobacteriia bacterium 4572_132]
MEYKVVEKFISVNGEGQKSGELSVFIRFAGCNLDCTYCDTKWANQKDVAYELMTENEIYSYIEGTGIKNITLTGGEPLLQENFEKLLEKLSEDENINIEIETNGSIDVSKFIKKTIKRPSFTLDYKSKSSKMEDKMLFENYNYINKNDTVKFVVGTMEDLKKSKLIMDKYELPKKTTVFFSPVFGKIEMSDIVEYMKVNKMNDVKLQIQLHKIIWDVTKKGV